MLFADEFQFMRVAHKRLNRMGWFFRFRTEFNGNDRTKQGLISQCAVSVCRRGLFQIQRGGGA